SESDSDLIHGLHQPPVEKAVPIPGQNNAMEAKHRPRHGNRGLETAGAKENPSCDDGDEGHRHPGDTSRSGRVSNRITSPAPQAVPRMVEHQENAVQSAPDDESPAGAMPQTSKQHGDQ